MLKFFFFLKRKYENTLVKRAARKANRYFEKTGNKFFVLWYNGKPLVKSKQNLKELIKEGTFKKGLTITNIEKMALYCTR